MEKKKTYTAKKLSRRLCYVTVGLAHPLHRIKQRELLVNPGETEASLPLFLSGVADD